MLNTFDHECQCVACSGHLMQHDSDFIHDILVVALLFDKMCRKFAERKRVCILGNVRYLLVVRRLKDVAESADQSVTMIVLCRFNASRNCC